MKFIEFNMAYLFKSLIQVTEIETVIALQVWESWIKYYK